MKRTYIEKNGNRISVLLEIQKDKDGEWIGTLKEIKEKRESVSTILLYTAVAKTKPEVTKLIEQHIQSRNWTRKGIKELDMGI